MCGLGGSVMPAMECILVIAALARRTGQRRAAGVHAPRHRRRGARARHHARGAHGLAGNAQAGNGTRAPAMQALLKGRLVFSPQECDGERFYTFEGEGTISPVIAGTAGLQRVWWPQRDAIELA